MELNWSVIKGKRELVKNNYSSNIFKIPLLYGNKKEIIEEILKGQGRKKLLDVGASTRILENFCLNHGILYKSMDIDKSNYHDYYSIDEINEQFNIILLLDVIEHLTLEEGYSLLIKLYHLLYKNGIVVITTPNNCHPTAFFSDCTHIISYRYYDLAALMLLAGFSKLEIFRVSSKTKTTHRILAFLLKPFMKFLNIDFASGILIIGEK